MDDNELLKDCVVDTYRGGSVEVRITHTPTGAVAYGYHNMSQYRARQQALAKLRAVLPQRT